MIGFERPEVFWLAIPWLGFLWYFAWRQRQAMEWVEARVAPRFRSLFTTLSPATLRRHLQLVFGLGLLLLTAAAAPTHPGGEGRPARGRVLLLVDASASMYAEDAAAIGLGKEPPKHRFEAVRRVAWELVQQLPDRRFALASFSGVATIHLPMTDDRSLIGDALRSMDFHTFYQDTGSRLPAALATAFLFLDDRQGDLQVVLLSDGEQPFPESFEEPVAALAELDIPVHTVAFGSTEGEARVIWDFADVIAKKDEKRALARYETRRVDAHLQRISKRTKGSFEVAAVGTPNRLAAAIAAIPVRAERLAADAARSDLSFLPLALFLVGFLIERLWVGRRRPPRGPAFELERLGSPPPTALLALACLLLATPGCRQGREWRAHRENEKGIHRDTLGRHAAAQPHYRRSIAFRERPHLPAYNLARSTLLEGDYSGAHELFQDTLKLEPDLAEAYYNDGVTLYRWGKAVRDPKDCQLERTRELWTLALERFDTTAKTAAGAPLGDRATTNRTWLGRELARVEELIADPPAACRQDGGSSDDESSQGGGNAEEEEQDKGEGDGESGGGEGGPDEDAGGGPGAEPPPAGSGGEGAGGGTSSMTGNELADIQEELARIRNQAREPGTVHYRTRPEQFGREMWANPEPVIWW